MNKELSLRKKRKKFGPAMSVVNYYKNKILLAEIMGSKREANCERQELINYLKEDGFEEDGFEEDPFALDLIHGLESGEL